MNRILDEHRPLDIPAIEDETHGMGANQKKELRDYILERNDGKISRAHMRLRQVALDIATILDQCQRQHDLAATSIEASTICVISDRVMRRLSETLRTAAYNTK